MSTLLFLTLNLDLIYVAKASSTFSPNCTLPPPHTNFVSGPNVRSTLSILWNCLSIILLCTWSIQHLNIPAGRRRTRSSTEKLWWTVLDARRKVKWMFFTIIVPEYLVGKALNDRLAVTYGVECMKGYGWDENCAYLANMGHFVLQFDKSLGIAGQTGPRLSLGAGSLAPDEPAPSDEAEGQTMNPQDGHRPSDAIPLISEPFQSQRPEVDRLWDFDRPAANFDYRELAPSTMLNMKRLEGRHWVLTTNQWFWVCQNGIADSPKVDTRDLDKLDRGGKLVKLLAVLQVSYLIIQLVAREVVHLPSAQLEITALAFAVSSLVTYILLWTKPQGVESIHVTKAKRHPTVQEVGRVAYFGPNFLVGQSRFRLQSRLDDDLKFMPIPNDVGHTMEKPYDPHSGHAGGFPELVAMCFGAVVGGVMFGGVHCLAWDFDFPTPGEALTWRVCSIAIVLLPLFSIPPLYMWIRLNPYINDRVKRPLLRRFVGFTLVFGCLVPYFLARSFLIFEVFRTLFFLPSDAFIDTWSGSFPHFG